MCTFFFLLFVNALIFLLSAMLRPFSSSVLKTTGPENLTVQFKHNKVSYEDIYHDPYVKKKHSNDYIQVCGEGTTASNWSIEQPHS